jgi:uncharacterized protein with FMN-binding domain
MRRSVLAIVGTVAGTALMLGAKLGTVPPGDPATAALTDDGAPAAADGPSGAPGAPAPPGPAASAPGAPGGPATSPPPGAAGPTPTTGNTPAPPPTTKPPTSGLKDGKFTGTGGNARYETVTVTITVSGGRISAASASCGNASGESRSICTDAVPTLVRETLSAQNATIATVSGATYTSRGYRSSLQSALDAAKA